MPTRPNRPLTRLLAAAWWLFMVLFTLSIVLIWTQPASHGSWGGVVGAVVLTAIIGIPIVHEWPNAQRMRRMLVDGT